MGELLIDLWKLVQNLFRIHNSNTDEVVDVDCLHQMKKHHNLHILLVKLEMGGGKKVKF